MQSALKHAVPSNLIYRSFIILFLSHASGSWQMMICRERKFFKSNHQNGSRTEKIMLKSCTNVAHCLPVCSRSTKIYSSLIKCTAKTKFLLSSKFQKRLNVKSQNVGNASLIQKSSFELSRLEIIFNKRRS